MNGEEKRNNKLPPKINLQLLPKRNPQLKKKKKRKNLSNLSPHFSFFQLFLFLLSSLQPPIFCRTFCGKVDSARLEKKRWRACSQLHVLECPNETWNLLRWLPRTCCFHLDIQGAHDCFYARARFRPSLVFLLYFQ